MPASIIGGMYPYEPGYYEAQRWRRVGATDEEIDGLLADYTDDWVGSVSDEDLEQALAGRRDPAEPPFDVAAATIPEVLAHVDKHPETVADVLAQEQSAAKPRVTLVKQLTELVDAAATPAEADPAAGAEGAIHAPPVTDDATTPADDGDDADEAAPTDDSEGGTPDHGGEPAQDDTASDKSDDTTPPTPDGG